MNNTAKCMVIFHHIQEAMAVAEELGNEKIFNLLMETGGKIANILDEDDNNDKCLKACQGEWITIEAGEDLLIDHHWYLIVHKDFRTPMKAKYHSDCPHFTFFYEGGEGCSYLFEDKITCYMKLPDIPMKGEEE